MRRIIFFFLITICYSAIGQIKYSQIQPCIDPVRLIPKDSCILMSGHDGVWKPVELSGLFDIDENKLCDILSDFPSGVLSSTDSIITKSLSGCKKVPSNYIVTPGALCIAAQSIPKSTYSPGDFLMFMRPNGTCYSDSIRWIQYGGSKWNCDSTIACLDDNVLFCNEVEECLENGSLCDAIKGFDVAGYDDSAYCITEYPDGSCKKILLSDITGQSSNFNCDSVAYCLLNDGRLCDALNAYGTTNYIPQYIIGVDNGNCFRVDGNLFGGGNNFNCDSVEQCLSGNPFFCNLVDSCLMNSSNLCNLIDSCLSNSDTLCDLVQACLDSIAWDSLVCVGLEGITGSNYVDGDSAIITRGGQCFKIPWYCCDTTGGQALQAGDCIEIVGDTVINVKVDPMSDNLLQCTANGLYVDPNTTCSNYQVQDIDANYQWVVYNPSGNDCYRAPINLNGDNCIGLNITTGALNAFMKISSDAGNTVECRANGLYAGGCNYSNSGQLTTGDLVVVQTANGCVTKTKTSEVCSLPNGGFGNTGCVEVLTRVGGVCQFRNYQLTACPPPDVPFAAMSTNKALEDKIKALELQNKLLEKRLAKLEKLIK